MREFGTTYWHLTAVEVVGLAGMALGGVLISGWSGFKNRWKTLAAALCISGFMMLGIGITMFATASTTVIQEQSDGNMQGKMFGFVSIMYSGCSSLGMAVFGLLADVVSMRITMGVTSILVVLVSIWTLYFAARFQHFASE